jgi:hypothetical protein
MRRAHVFLVAALLGVEAHAQALVAPHAELASRSDSMRMNAFARLQSDAVKAAGIRPFSSPESRTSVLAAIARDDALLRRELLDLLARENERAASAARGSLPEEYFAGYKMDLTVTVARIGDPSAFRLLLPSVSAGDVVTSGIAAGGDRAVDDLLAIWASDPAPTRRFGAAVALAKVLAVKGPLAASTSSRGRIRTAMLRALKDKDRFILRMGAVHTLGGFSDGTIANEMRRLARTDDFFSVHDGNRSYPVREAATRWLAAKGFQP